MSDAIFNLEKIFNIKISQEYNELFDDLYKFFIERYYNLLKKNGAAGIVLPAGLLINQGTTGLRELLAHYELTARGL